MNMFFYRTLQFLLLLLLWASHASMADECDFSEVNSAVEAILDKYPIIPGIGLQIGYPNEVIYEKYWEQYDSDTIVPLASASKLISAVTIMSLVDEGLIDLDEPVSSYLPQFTGDKGLMTVRQMFSHTAGMPNNSQMQNLAILSAFNGLNLAQAVDLLACCEPLMYQPGTGFAYGGSSMHIAGRVAEVVGEDSWIELFNKYLTTPLGITRMDYNGLGVTTNYRLAGGAQSSLSDYGKVLNMLLNKGRYQTNRVLSEQAITTLLTDNVGDLEILYSPAQADLEVRYGIGNWLELDDNGKTTSLSSPGAFGFTPWVDYELNYYAAFMVKDSNSRMSPLVAEIRQKIEEILANNWCGMQAPELTQDLGLWYDPNKSGHGIEIQKIGTTYSGVFYTFSDTGAPEWYLLSVNNQVNQLDGDFLRINNLGNSEVIDAQSQIAGHYSMDFTPSSSNCIASTNNPRVELNWSIGNEQGVWCLQPLLTVNSRPKTNANGWWWNGATDSGWGFDSYANENTEFRVIYYYDALGNPIWSYGLSDTASNAFSMQSPLGYCRLCEKIPLQSTEIGQFTGALKASALNSNSEITLSLDLANWQRFDFIPQVFSNPAY